MWRSVWKKNINFLYGFDACFFTLSVELKRNRFSFSLQIYEFVDLRVPVALVLVQKFELEGPAGVFAVGRESLANNATILRVLMFGMATNAGRIVHAFFKISFEALVFAEKRLVVPDQGDE